MVRLTSILVAVSLAACQLGAAASFEVRLPSPGEGISPRDVVVVDHAGVVSGVVSEAPADWTEGVSRSDRPGRVIVSWLGGCMRHTRDPLDRLGGRRPDDPRDDGDDGRRMPPGGHGRSVALDLNRVVAPEAVRLVSDPGT